MKTVIGIDPGTATLGYAFVKRRSFEPEIIDYGVLKTRTSSTENMPDRLLEIGKDLETLIVKNQPEIAVVEEVFFFKNAKTVISVAQSRGLILYLLAKHQVKIISVTPLQVKQTLCGYGRASKSEIQTMVKKLYKLNKYPKPDDAADALAMAWIGLS